MSTSPFSRFTGNKLSGAKKKEFFKQEKRKAKKETRDYFQQLKESQRTGAPPPPKGRKGTKPFSEEPKYTKSKPPATPGRNSASPVSRQSTYTKGKPPATTGKTGAKPVSEETKYSKSKPPTAARNSARPASGQSAYTKGKPPATAERNSTRPVSGQSKYTKGKPPVIAGRNVAAGRTSSKPVKAAAPEPEMPLNKYIAHCGICSRRDAAILVQQEKITVNGAVVTTPGYKVQPNDVVKMGKQTLTVQATPVYLLLNKPKDCLTTMDDPHGRDTVLRYIRNATSERVYPVGRLDRNTTGVLILTNDGELAQKLTHPSFEVRKIYEVHLDRPLEKGQYDKIVSGITLDDGFIAPDAVGFPDPKDKSIIGIEIHSGRNRIVRRIFEYFGYKIKSLDRVSFANLTKKNVERGKWRFLQEREVRNLKFMNTTAMKKKKV